MGKIDGQIVVDPNADEWNCMDARITITTDSNENICAMQKGGSEGFTHDEIINCAETSISVGRKIRETLKRVKEDKQ